MNLRGALAVAQQKTQLSTSDNLVFDFFIRGDERLSELEYFFYLQKAKAAIRKLYQSMYSGIEGFVKSYIIPYTELIKFIIEMTPTVVKILAIILPLVLQREYKASKWNWNYQQLVFPMLF